MKVVVAIDSLKGSLSSIEAGNAIANGIKRVINADVKVMPLADGGEGTVDALVNGMDGEMCIADVTGPLGEKRKARYGIIKETKTAIIEMAESSGITLVPKDKRNPMFTTTYGVGDMIKDAISKGCRRFIIGIGGSATNDGGAGMLQSLGFDFLDDKGEKITYGASGLSRLKTINNENVIPELKECTFRIACDVNNPLCGPKGCSAVYGPQKGADNNMVREMDVYLKRYAQICKEKYPNSDDKKEGTGAAGGLGFAFLTFLNAELESGISIILDEIHLEDAIKDADIVITGEGRLDFQTAMGKAPIGVAKLAKKYNKKVLAFAGSVSNEAKECNVQGIDAYFPILRSICTLEEAMDDKNAWRNMEDSVEQVFRLINLYL